MSEGHQIAPGVLVDEYDLDARFTRGSLEGLAVGVRDAVWKHIELVESADLIKVFVGGNRKRSLDPPLEVAVVDQARSSTVAVPPELERALKAARSRNLPAAENSLWECTCAVYCDQSHGEGRIEFRILKPTFHEMAAVAVGSN
jgi:hypothetical protein